jgi:Ca2+-binding EF-hand superfamily protein
MKPHHSILGAMLVFAGLTSAAFADPKHDKKKPAKHDKHAVHRTVLFHEMDDNHDGVISRHEWRGSRESFRQHDWNDNGILSGEEISRGSAPVSRTADRRETAPRTAPIRTERDEVLFARRDLNHDGRITRDEWGDAAAFSRLDKNHDNVVSAYEYGVGR